ncbi:TPA: EamA family transporter [Candidatus Woesearchaeota archaeon]|nr:EamA family transporter [Candidatus Woesearchaeota archaeon]HIH47199.1 EamA family transporter [Candidatus Woesearchaeota archaeon]
MEWFILALLAAIFHAILNGCVKHYLRQYHRYVLAGGVILSGGLLLMLASGIQGFPRIQEGFWVWAIVCIIGVSIANIYYYKALDVGELSLVIPMLAFTPVFMLLTSMLMLNEFPATKGLIGILLVVGGSYVINFEKSRQWLLPFQKFYTNKGIRYMFIVATVYSVTGNIDKILTLKSNASFAGGLVKLSSGLFLVCWMCTQKQGVKEMIKPRLWLIALGIGVFSALVTYVQFTANTLTLVPYVISVKRLSILFSILIGYFFFQERQFGQRFLGGALMVIGTYLILMATV